MAQYSLYLAFSMSTTIYTGKRSIKSMQMSEFTLPQLHASHWILPSQLPYHSTLIATWYGSTPLMSPPTATSSSVSVKHTCSHYSRISLRVSSCSNKLLLRPRFNTARRWKGLKQMKWVRSKRASREALDRLRKIVFGNMLVI